MSEKTSGPAFNTQPAGLEKNLAEFYTKTVTFNLPENVRKWLADNVWWLTLVGGVLSLLGAVSAWNAAHFADSYLSMARSVGVQVQNNLGIMFYLAIGVMVAEGVLYLLAFQKLQKHQKAGWNLLFYVSLLSLVLAVLYLFVPGYGAGSLVGTIIGTFIGWFLLFQVRKYFVK